MIRSLLKHYADADEATREAGRVWYAGAEREARELSRKAGRGIGPVACAGVLAALSPRAQWSVNVRWARAIVDAERDCPKVGLGNGRAKAWAIRNGERPDAVLRGPKVRAFWRAMTGDPDAAVIDVWMLRAMGIESASVTPKVYEECATALREASAACGESVRDFQAIVWMQIRGVKPTDPVGFRPVEGVV